jgi:hypothetical protein
MPLILETEHFFMSHASFVIILGEVKGYIKHNRSKG